MNARADALTIMPLFTENSRSLKGSAGIAVHLPPFESRYCQFSGSEGFLFFIRTSNVV
ncbi:hypothetical protein [Xenorhabdus innexi]|uniref:hypothetical protein n=1 Tax=Xenorhabdus innexi TaxID=290109 RepID=UPI0014761568|nr:hypothetical protein [Xenorhabdus innexi]